MPSTSEASALAYIRRESLDIYNRIQSIGADIAFVEQVRAAYPAVPLIRSVVRLLSTPSTLTSPADSKPPLWSVVH
jgi:hypothetical protein